MSPIETGPPSWLKCADPFKSALLGTLGTLSIAVSEKCLSLIYSIPQQKISGPIGFIKIGLITPFFEESVHRGIIRSVQIDISKQRGENPHSKASVASRVVLNSALFTLTHYSRRHPFSANVRIAGPLFLSGVVFAGLTEITDNIWAATFSHSTVNIVALHFKKR